MIPSSIRDFVSRCRRPFLTHSAPSRRMVGSTGCGGQIELGAPSATHDSNRLAGRAAEFDSISHHSAAPSGICQRLDGGEGPLAPWNAEIGQTRYRQHPDPS